MLSSSSASPFLFVFFGKSPLCSYQIVGQLKVTQAGHGGSDACYLATCNTECRMAPVLGENHNSNTNNERQYLVQQSRTHTDTHIHTHSHTHSPTYKHTRLLKRMDVTAILCKWLPFGSLSCLRNGTTMTTLLAQGVGWKMHWEKNNTRRFKRFTYGLKTL